MIHIKLRVEAAGLLTLGPKPGTPEYDEERRCLREGIPYDYSKGAKLLIQDEKGEPSE